MTVTKKPRCRSCTWFATRWEHGIAYIFCGKCGRVGDYVAVKVPGLKRYW